MLYVVDDGGTKEEATSPPLVMIEGGKCEAVEVDMCDGASMGMDVVVWYRCAECSVAFPAAFSISSIENELWRLLLVGCWNREPAVVGGAAVVDDGNGGRDVRESGCCCVNAGVEIGGGGVAVDVGCGVTLPVPLPPPPLPPMLNVARLLVW